jgi:peroxiredoxin Q/BCP
MTTNPMDLQGKRAPEFTAPTDAGDELTLSSLRGRIVVLFFYPKDDTSG